MPEQELHSADKLDQKLGRYADVIGNLCVDAFHYLALFAIGATVVWSAGHEFILMTEKGRASIEDILLLFIYLELGAMVGIYFRTRRMPVRFLIYVAITALTRMMVGHIQVEHTPDLGILYIAGGILLLAAATLVVRFGSYRYPSDRLSDERAEPAP